MGIVRGWSLHNYSICRNLEIPLAALPFSILTFQTVNTPLCPEGNPCQTAGPGFKNALWLAFFILTLCHFSIWELSALVSYPSLLLKSLITASVTSLQIGVLSSFSFDAAPSVYEYLLLLTKSFIHESDGPVAAPLGYETFLFLSLCFRSCMKSLQLPGNPPCFPVAPPGL